MSTRHGEQQRVRAKKAQEAAKVKEYDDGMTTTERRAYRIKKASGNAWWVKSYLMGNLTHRDTDSNGIDDE
jgi:hypothetical protein